MVCVCAEEEEVKAKISKIVIQTDGLGQIKWTENWLTVSGKDNVEAPQHINKHNKNVIKSK